MSGVRKCLQTAACSLGLNFGDYQTHSSRNPRRECQQQAALRHPRAQAGRQAPLQPPDPLNPLTIQVTLATLVRRRFHHMPPKQAQSRWAISQSPCIQQSKFRKSGPHLNTDAAFPFLTSDLWSTAGLSSTELGLTFMARCEPCMIQNSRKVILKAKLSLYIATISPPEATVYFLCLCCCR